MYPFQPMQRRRARAFATFLLAAAAACGGADEVTGAPAGEIPSAVMVSPGQVELVVGKTTQLIVDVRDARGGLVPQAGVAWRSLEPEVAQVAHGLVIGRASGEARIVATVAGVADTATVTVTEAPGDPVEPGDPGEAGVVARVTLDVGAVSVFPGATSRLVATAVDARGKPVADATVRWKSEHPGVATVSATGVVTGVSLGVTRVVAAAGSHADTVQVTVAPPPVARVELVAGFGPLEEGQSGTLSVVARDARGNELEGRPVSYRTSDARVATVSASGVVTAMGVGTATITATSEGVSAQLRVEVVREPVVVASVTVAPGTLTLDPGKSAPLAVTLRDRAGAEIASYPVTWTTSDGAVAKVSAAGVVTAVAPGTATVTVRAGERSATVAVTVTTPPPPVPVDVALDAVAVGTVAELEGAQFYLPDILVAGEDEGTGVAPMQAFVTYSLAALPADAPVQSAHLTVTMSAHGVFGAPFALGPLVADHAATLALNTTPPDATAVLVTDALRSTVRVDVTALVRAARDAGAAEVTIRLRFTVPRDHDGATDQLEIAAGALDVTYLK